MRTSVRSLVVCVLVVLFVGAVSGAALSIRGKVVDSAGAVIPGATVELTLNGSQVKTAVTNEKGEFEVNGLAPGDYLITVSLAGFRTLTQNLQLREGTMQPPLAFMLDVGGVAETVTVAASSPMLQAQMSGGGSRHERAPRPLYPKFSTAAYDPIKENGFKRAKDAPLSTFSIDVDTASYANVRRFLTEGTLPPADAVRLEELINYFHFDYAAPPDGRPFSVTTELGRCPWNDRHQLALIGLQSRPISLERTPPRNLVFLLDVSGSMQPPNRLPLVKSAMMQLTDTLREEDRVAIVVYAGASGLALPSTPGSRRAEIDRAIQELRAGGSTNGAAGINLAYQIASENFVKDGINRVILATDGDFNVGVTSQGDLVRLIEQKRESGIFLSVLGVGDDNLKDSTMEKLADAGNGNYSYLDSLLEARRVLVKEAGATLATVAKDVKIQIEFNPARVQGYRLIGYENRVLASEDFKDDSKDAGEMGAGHTVTALYEIVPAGADGGDLPSVDPLKYQSAPAPVAGHAGELMTVKLRYKAPRSRRSVPMSVVVGAATSPSSSNLGFAAAVAEFGMLLRDSPHKANASWRQVTELAERHRGDDSDGYRAEFIRLAGVAGSLTRRDSDGAR